MSTCDWLSPCIDFPRVEKRGAETLSECALAQSEAQELRAVIGSHT